MISFIYIYIKSLYLHQAITFFTYIYASHDLIISSIVSLWYNITENQVQNILQNVSRFLIWLKYLFPKTFLLSDIYFSRGQMSHRNKNTLTIYKNNFLATCLQHTPSYRGFNWTYIN